MSKPPSSTAIAEALSELSEYSIERALKKGVSKILQETMVKFNAINEEFIEEIEDNGGCERIELNRLAQRKIRVLRKTDIVGVIINELIVYGNRRINAQSGGKQSSVTRQTKNAARDQEIISKYQKQCGSGKNPGFAAKIAKQYDMTPRQVRNIVNNFKKNGN